MDDTPNLTLPYIVAAQAQKHVTHNEALRTLDAIVQLMVLDRDLAAPPASPADGDRYIVAASPTGSWSGQAGKIAAFQDGAWTYYAPREGWLAWIADENTLLAHDGAAWGPLPLAELQNMSLLGVNATADATNRFALASDASLFNHDGSGHRQKINKAAAGDTASQLYQTGFSGRAEFGLIGNDDFTVKVSPDGSTWHDAIVADKDTGAVSFPNTTMVDVQEFTSSGTWTKPAGATKVFVQIISGGGGGGGGARVASGNACSGGGGGGAGFYAERWFDASFLGSTETVTIGAGGTGGAGATSDGTAGGNGAGGGQTSFGTKFSGSKGGGGGAGGQLAANSGGGGSGGAFGAGGNATSATAGAAGSTGGTAGGSGSNGGGGTVHGGGGGGAGGTNAGAGSTGGVSMNGAGGGGSGGGMAASPGNLNGGAMGNNLDGATGSGNGVAPGGNGAGGSTVSRELKGCGGAGGGNNTAGAGGNGGTGGNYGAGGGGGGSAVGGNGGSGGNGAPGYCRVTTFF